MDKSWIRDNNRFSASYINGVQSFLTLAKQNMGMDNFILCPCVKCNNVIRKTTSDVEVDLHINGFSYTYTEWIFHGEREYVVDNSEDDLGNNAMDPDDLGDELNELIDEMAEAHKSNNACDVETESFRKLLMDNQRELYPGCKMSLLSVIVKLLHLKVLGKWSNKSFNMLLEFLKDILPQGVTLPSSLYATRKVLVEIGLGYEEIDACKNDCALFWKENEKEEKCPICKESRWKYNDSKSKQVPQKILRYFPVKPRLQRLFMSKKTASNMTWHKNKRVDEVGSARHPADSLAWKHLDQKYPDFSEDARNVRLGLASDGFTPWSNLGSAYSMWPVILVVYNLPPYECMRDSSLMMPLLIPGPNSPGKDIDVYLRPLIDELNELWGIGVETYDICSKKKFQMRAAVLWTISDLPGLSILSGWVTMGHYACPCCYDETYYEQLRTKTCFPGHRRYLHKNHSFRKNKRDFNGKEEHRGKPRVLSGDDVLHWLESLGHLFEKPGKHSINGKRKRSPDQVNWVKKSIFFELPYWHKLLIRHNLDVMHIEKNICDNILGTLLDIKGKTKDTVTAREDLRDLRIREELHMRVRASDNKPIKPHASFTLSSTEKNGFYHFLKSVKFPDGYAANISKCVKDNKITGLKSHDCHVLLQRLIPAGIRGYLTKEVNEALYELGDFFKELCSKTLKDEDVERLEKNIPIILCKLEKIFPPYFFTIMVHLAVHLPQEARIAGPVQFRWMYPIERFLGFLKGFVRNRARPEGSIAEAYIVHESLTFLSLYLPDMETKFNRRKRNYDGIHDQGERLSVFSMKCRPFGDIRSGHLLSEEELKKAHWYILTNCEEVESYIKMHKAELLGVSLSEVGDLEGHDLRQEERFPHWFKEHMNLLHHQTSEEATDEMWALANGPVKLDTKCYTGCIVNEVRFRTRDRDQLRKTQNSGLVVEGKHKDKFIEFFGFLNKVVELTYLGGYKVILFQCEWFDMGSRKTVQNDKHFISIDVRSRWYKDDPFVLPIQVQQVFYINDTKLGKHWQIVQRVQHRHLWDLPELEVENNLNETYSDEQTQMVDGLQQYSSNGVRQVDDADDQDLGSQLARDDLEPEEVDKDLFFKLRNLKNREDKNRHNGENEDTDFEDDNGENENDSEEINSTDSDESNDSD